jgi:hypothetical protein
MKKLYIREIDCCWYCPNHEVDEGLEVSGWCKALPNSVGIPLDFNSFENILDDCPLRKRVRESESPVALARG